MSPRQERLEPCSSEAIAMSIGGSVFRPERLNSMFVNGLLYFFEELIGENRTVIAVVGGGGEARNLEADVKRFGVDHKQSIDQIGISVTQVNRLALKALLEKHHIRFHMYNPGDLIEPAAGTVYLLAGTEPGHTTDFVTGKVAYEVNLHCLINISKEPGGINVRDDNGNPIEEELYAELTWDEFGKIFPDDYSPGMHVPFDPQAVRFAKENDLTVIMVGPDFTNLQKCLVGQEFVGTIIHP